MAVKQKNYNSVNYDPKQDYQSLINIEKQKSTPDQTKLSQYNSARQAKIQGENMTQYMNKNKTAPIASVPPNVNNANFNTNFANKTAPIASVPPNINNSIVNKQNNIPSYTAPTVPKQTSYNNQYAQQINDTLTQIGNLINNKKQYDYDSDAGLKAAQQQASDNVVRQMSRRNVVNSSMTPEQIYEASLGLIPQFQQQYQQQQQQDINNVMNQLGLIQQQEGTGYNRYRDTVGDTRYLDELLYGRGRDVLGDTRYDTEYANQIGQQNLQNARYDTEYANQLANEQSNRTGNYLSPEQMESLKNIDPTLSQYSNDFQSEINKRAAVNPNDPSILQLQALRNLKIQSGNLPFEQSQLGQQTLTGKQVQSGLKTEGLQQEGMGLSNEQQKIINKYMPEQMEKDLTSAELSNVGQKISNEISQINLDNLPEQTRIAIATAQEALKNGQLNNAAQIIENSNLDESMKASIASTWAGVLNTEAGTERTYADLNALSNQGGVEFKYNGADVTNKTQDYLRNFGYYNPDTKKYQIQDGGNTGTGKNNGIPDNQGKILSAMGKEYSQNASDGYYNMLKDTASKMGISNSDFAKAMSGYKTTSSGAGVIETAKNYIGTPYVWGGNSLEKGVDCSGLTQQTFKQYGIDLPRTASEQSKIGTSIKSMSDLKPGDLVFFDTVSNNKKVDHVGIYQGNNEMVHASSSNGVKIASIDTPYWKGKFVKGSRVM